MVSFDFAGELPGHSGRTASSFGLESTTVAVGTKRTYVVMPASSAISALAIVGALHFVVFRAFSEACASVTKEECSDVSLTLLRSFTGAPGSFFGICLAQEVAGGAPHGVACISTALNQVAAAATFFHTADGGSHEWLLLSLGDLLSLLWVLPWSRRPGLLFSTVFLGLALGRGIRLFQWYLLILKEFLPGILAGFVAPGMLKVFEKVGWKMAVTCWKCFHRDAPLLVMGFFAAYIVVGTEALRLSNFIIAVQTQKNIHDAIQHSGASLLSSIFAEVIGRSCALRAFFSAWCTGKVFSPSPETDLLLRTRIGFGYVQLWCTSWILFLALLGKLSLHPMMCFFFALVFTVCSQVLSDVACYAVQHLLATGTLNDLSIAETSTRLFEPGAHLAPRFHLRAPRPSMSEATMGTKLDLVPDVLGCFPADRTAGAYLVLLTLHLTLRPTLHYFFIPTNAVDY